MVNPESQVEPGLIPSLDPSVLTLSEVERSFLRTVISPDDEEVRKRLLEVQKM